MISECKLAGLKEWIIAFLICWGVAYLFYKSLIIMLIASFGVFFLVHIQIQSKEKKKKWKLTLEFKDGIISLANALTAGYSIENAFDEAVKDLCFLYDKDSEIVSEFRLISQQIRLNRNVEDLLMEFGVRTGIEDVLSFAEVVMTAKRAGGDLIKVMKTTSNNIGDKIDVQREIITLIAAKKLEGNLMSIIPLGIIIYLDICMPNFLMPMYEGLVGRSIMTISLICYVLALRLLNSIVTIKI